MVPEFFCLEWGQKCLQQSEEPSEIKQWLHVERKGLSWKT